MKARATKEQMQRRKDTVRRWVRNNPGNKVSRIAQGTGLPVEITRQTVTKLCLETTKRGFKMYRMANRYFTQRPTGTRSKQTVTDKEFFVSTPQELKQQAKQTVTDLLEQKQTVTDSSKAQQNDERQLERWLSAIELNNNRTLRQLDSVTGHIERQRTAAIDFATELHTLREAVLDFLEGGVTITTLRALVGNRPKKEGEQ